MKKDTKELTENEELEFCTEILRLFKMGAAMQMTASENADEESKGWPFIEFMGDDSDVKISFCHVLETVLEFNRAKVLSSLGPIVFSVSIEAIMDLAIHDAMHDAFCLGLAIRDMYEMDLKGLEELLDELDKLDPDIER